MNKFYSMLTIAAAAVALAAPASGAPAPSPDLLKPVKLAADAPRMVQADIPAAKRSAAKTADEQWSAWEQIGTASFDQNLIDTWTLQCGWLNTSMPEFTQPFAIEGRLSQSDETKGELRLRNIFGGVDILLPYDTRTGYFAPEPQSTAIPLNTPGYNDNIMLSVRGYYYPSAKKIDFKSIFFLIVDNSGYNCGTSVLIMDGAQEVKFSLETNHFIPSTATSLTVNVDRSSNVAWYRVVSNENPMSYDDLSAYFAKEPVYAPNVYTDYTGDSFTLSPWGMSAIQSGYIVIPFGADDRVIGSYQVANVYYNYNFHYGYNTPWNSLGRGRMVEDAVYNGYTPDAYNEIMVDGAPVKTPFASTPELEMTTDGSLLCVKNPFGPEHPASSKLIENYPEAKSDDFYMVFDISDPSRVRLCETLTGLKNNGYAQMAFYSEAGTMLEDGNTVGKIDSLEVCLWGKFADNRLTIPRNSSSIGSSYGDDFEITVELPGYVDYDIKAEPAVTSDGTAYNSLLSNVSPNIVSVDYALVPESYYKENRNFPERVPDAFADASGPSRVRKSAATGFSVRNVATNGASSLTLSIPEEEVGYGNWVLAAVGRDANGNAHSAFFVPQVISKTRPLSEWRNAGTVKVCDGIVGSIYQSKPTVSFNVEILENPDAEGVYLLPNYYNLAFASLGVNGTFDSEVADPFVLDLRGDYPLLTNSLSGARCTGEMMTGIEIPVNEESTWQLRVMNGCDHSAGNYGWITRGDDGSIEKVDFSNLGLVVMIYESHSGDQLGSLGPDRTWIDFTYDVATDPYIFDNWRPVGTVTVTENIVSDVVAEGSESSCEAEIFAHPTEAGIYCVPEPLGGMKWTGVCDSYVNTSSDYPFVINATDPSKVFVARDLGGQRTGDIFWFTGWWLTADKAIYLCLMANAIESGALQGDGWSVDSVLGTYDAENAEFNLDRCFASTTDRSSLQCPPTPKFRVKFNTSSVDEAAVSAAGVVSVEYYTVDGRRLASPADGITIRRTLYSDGRTTTDKLLR